MKVSHAFTTQVRLGDSLNRDRNFLSIPTDFQHLSSLHFWSLKSVKTLLRPVKVFNKSDFSPLVRNSIISFSGSTANRSKQGSLKHYARNVTVGIRKGLQEARASTSAVEEKELKYLVSDYGWRVRLLTTEKEEMDAVADIQSAAFYSPAPIWDSFFYMIFKAEVLGALLYKLRNSPPNRYACLVAETDYDTTDHGMANKTKQEIVGVVDVTAYTDKDVLFHLGGAVEYLYVSGIAVGENYRRRKVATVLLKACDFMAFLWGFEYLVLRAYGDDVAARTLYSRAGYQVVSQDPPWASTWIGKKQRVLMVKRVSNDKL
ncbi:hypothetical protein SUGI_0294810 [Cryptomeria japonica]|nr:hypothetical protein SUGI_0294810 [Cryptomeria japonica]